MFLFSRHRGPTHQGRPLCVLLIIFIVFIGCSVSSIRKGLEDTLSGDVRTLSGDVRTLSGDVRGFCIALTKRSNLPQDKKIPLPGEEGAMLSEETLVSQLENGPKPR